MNWLIEFDNHDEGWLSAACIVSTENDISVGEAIRLAGQQLDRKQDMNGYQTVRAKQVIA